MKLAFEIVLIWTVLNFVVGIPVWMLVKRRDRLERAAEVHHRPGAYAGESNSNHARAVVMGRALPHVGPVVMGAVARDRRQVARQVSGQVAGQVAGQITDT